MKEKKQIIKSYLMKLVEKHIIKRGTDVFKELDYLCFL